MISETIFFVVVFVCSEWQTEAHGYNTKYSICCYVCIYSIRLAIFQRQKHLSQSAKEVLYGRLKAKPTLLVAFNGQNTSLFLTSQNFLPWFSAASMFNWLLVWALIVPKLKSFLLILGQTIKFAKVLDWSKGLPLMSFAREPLITSRMFSVKMGSYLNSCV